ncbi:two-component system response regulator RegA [Litorivivens lipolytica]|uniref:Two-component system response regulator RegA n=1 Tax=Litorivivens lipolytica TaxID=1524264 RepID=A0A7W4W5J8_9GAMM|nr:response regulator [Litorivivens lipolytica]MBB3047873.1 two-component system response regulator RegA [Litorivivens lipolytica]
MSEQNLLLVDDDKVFVDVMARALEKRGFKISCANGVDEAEILLSKQVFQKALVDLKMEGRSGLSLIELLQAKQPKCRVIMLTGYSSIATAVEAMRLGAYNYLCKPASIKEVLAAFDTQVSADVDVPDNPPSVERVEWEHIQKVLAENDGNVSATARALGMHRRTLQRKLLKKPVRQ